MTLANVSCVLSASGQGKLNNMFHCLSDTPWWVTLRTGKARNMDVSSGSSRSSQTPAGEVRHLVFPTDLKVVVCFLLG